jgi:hypothetical protein
MGYIERPEQVPAGARVNWPAQQDAIATYEPVLWLYMTAFALLVEAQASLEPAYHVAMRECQSLLAQVNGGSL